MKFILNGSHDDLLSRLFEIGEDGRAFIGAARSSDVVGKLDALDKWTLFADYLMEGFVPYNLRLLRTDDGSVLEIKLAGTNRDQYVPSAVRGYIHLAGLRAEQELHS